MQNYLMNWCHENLKHPGGDRICLTLKHHFYWKGVKNSVKIHVNFFETCQLNTLPKSNCVKLPMKDNTLDMEPWKR